MSKDDFYMFSFERIRREKFIRGLSNDFDIAELFSDIARSFKLNIKDDYEIRKKTLEVIEWLLSTGQFDVVVLEDLKIRKENFGEEGFFLQVLEDENLRKQRELEKGLPKKEIMLKINSFWNAVDKNSDLTFKIWISLTEKGFNDAIDYYRKVLDLNEKVLFEVDCKEFIDLEEIASAIRKEFNTNNPEEIKYEALDIVTAIDVKLGFLKRDNFYEWKVEDDFELERIVEEKWQELLEEEDPDKKLWIRNTEETTKRIQEWRENGSKGKIFPEWYETEGLL